MANVRDRITFWAAATPTVAATPITSADDVTLSPGRTGITMVFEVSGTGTMEILLSATTGALLTITSFVAGVNMVQLNGNPTGRLSARWTPAANGTIFGIGYAVGARDT